MLSTDCKLGDIVRRAADEHAGYVTWWVSAIDRRSMIARGFLRMNGVQRSSYEFVIPDNVEVVGHESLE